MQIAKHPVTILHKSIAGRYRPVRVADGPITACCRFIKNASWVRVWYNNYNDKARIRFFHSN